VEQNSSKHEQSSFEWWSGSNISEDWLCETKVRQSVLLGNGVSFPNIWISSESQDVKMIIGDYNERWP